MSEEMTKKIFEREIVFINNLIRQVRSLIGPLTSMTEERLVNFHPFFLLLKSHLEAFKRENPLEFKRIRAIEEDLVDLEEQIVEFEKSSVFAGE